VAARPAKDKPSYEIVSQKRRIQLDAAFLRSGQGLILRGDPPSGANHADRGQPGSRLATADSYSIPKGRHRWTKSLGRIAPQSKKERRIQLDAAFLR
ncbi:hypothetical protein, partial [Rhodopseudomonas palustris]|uniref:hypothetical protein n=1 Tax=Rhodopseudomonas palustris TaxID=1076 RepID=UPI00136494B3